MRPQSAFIIFVIVTNLILLTSFFVFAKFDKTEIIDNSVKSEKPYENLKNVCENGQCLRFCKVLTSEQLEDANFVSFLSSTQRNLKNVIFGDPCKEMEILDIPHWNATIEMSGSGAIEFENKQNKNGRKLVLSSNEYCLDLSYEEDINNPIAAENKIKREVLETDEGSGDPEISSDSTLDIEISTLGIFLNEPDIEADETATDEQTEVTEMLEELEKKTFIWKLKICKAEPADDVNTYETKRWFSLDKLNADFELIYTIIFFVNIGFLSITLILYALINELKSSVHGRCVIGFVISIIFAVSCAFPMPFHVQHFFDFWIIKELSLYYKCAKIFRVFAFIWMNLMIFDVFWTLRNFHTSSGGKFKNYFFTFIGLSIFVVVGSLFDVRCTLAILSISIFFGILWFLSAAKIFYDLTGVVIDFGQKRFRELETRFVVYLQLFSLLLVTTLIDCFTFDLESKIAWNILAIAEVVQSFMIFIVFVVRRRPREIIVRNICIL